ncbi:hypothetical protein PHMEG_00027429 [Phytophthora megakarya]|uniref:Eukaryotic/viral aspartic protease n=1 Tax=Phytophthora megakarya TaxID=4795 RepID=A0A225V8W2_9STRA|nr:hypothetical protein PHMEG_00027429 [Phytophthora megakarya]
MEAPADPDLREDPLTKQTKVKAEPYSFFDPDKPTLYMPKDPQVSRSEVEKPRSKTLRTKTKAPEYEEDGDQGGSGWSVEDLKHLYHRKEIRDFVCQDPVMKILKLKWIAEPKDIVTIPAMVTNKLDAVTILIKLLKEAGMTPRSFETDDLFDLDLTVIQATSRDLFGKMESIRSPDRRSNWEYDPDDIDFPAPAQATVATAASGSTGSTMIQRVQISAISDRKGFTGKDQDEDPARAWISKVKSAFMRDQASDDEKCLTFADLLAGSAKNWYRQLSRSTRNKWCDLLHSFQIQFCGLGVSVARQYYYTRRTSDESPLDYLYRLNVAGLRARLKIKDGSAKERREHVDHYIETLEAEQNG